jgi:hypothetical protein
MTMTIHGHDLRDGCGRNYLRLIFVERSVAAAAKIVDGTELNEKTAITPDYFPRIYRGKICGHPKLGVARAGIPETRVHRVSI